MLSYILRSVHWNFALALTVLAAGCSGGGTTTTYTGPDTGVDTSTNTGTNTGACTVGPAQGPSEPCCIEYGVDACGAALVCAAIEGRTVPSCYPEGTQAGLEECTVDALCVSGDCEEAVGLCKSTAGEPCQEDVGCADPTGAFENVICAGVPTSTGINPSTLTCETPTQLGGECGYCLSDVNCNSAGTGFVCWRGRCMGTVGTVPSDPSCCIAGSSLVGGVRTCDASS